MKITSVLVAAICAIPALSFGMTLDDLTTGKTVSGPDVSLKDMKGKIVFVDYWGTH